MDANIKVAVIVGLFVFVGGLAILAMSFAKPIDFRIRLSGAMCLIISIPLAMMLANFPQPGKPADLEIYALGITVFLGILAALPGGVLSITRLLKRSIGDDRGS